MSLPRSGVDPAIRTARARDFYLAYLNSSAWKTRRNRALRLAHWCCQRCESKRDLQVHHKSYERLGAEWDQDLEVVCVNCHEQHHIQETAKSSLGIYLRIAAEALRKTPLAEIADLSEDTKVLCAKYHVAYDGPHIHRALELVLGRRFIRVAKEFREDGTKPSPTTWTAQDAHEFLCRLRSRGIELPLKSMPRLGTSYSERAGHEQRLREQVAEQQLEDYRAERRHVPLRERLERIFTGEE